MYLNYGFTSIAYHYFYNQLALKRYQNHSYLYSKYGQYIFSEKRGFHMFY